MKSKMKSEIKSTKNNKKSNSVTRKDFLLTSAFLGSVAAVATSCKKVSDKLANISNKYDEDKDFVYPLSQPENIIYSVCLQPDFYPISL